MNDLAGVNVQELKAMKARYSEHMKFYRVHAINIELHARGEALTAAELGKCAADVRRRMKTLPDIYGGSDIQHGIRETLDAQAVALMEASAERRAEEAVRESAKKREAPAEARSR